METPQTDRPTPLGAAVASHTWYHTIALGDGVVTPGEYDTRKAVAKIPFPADLSGKRCLDIGTHDGFWAFEMERRGAAEVIAIDLDDPRRVDISEPVPELRGELLADREARPKAFWCAHRALASKVDRRDFSVYDLNTDELGSFDFAFLGTLLLHLREPVRALTAIRKVLRPGGTLLVNDPVSLMLTVRHPRRPVHELTLQPSKPFWWIPNVRGLQRYVEKAAFTEVTGGGPYLVRNGPGFARPKLPRSAGSLVTRKLHERGMLHAWASGRAPA